MALFAQQKLLDIPGTIFWKVYPRNDPMKVSYILGTDHFYGGSFVDSLPGLKKKVRDAELFIRRLQLTNNVTNMIALRQPTIVNSGMQYKDCSSDIIILLNRKRTRTNLITIIYAL